MSDKRTPAEVIAFFEGEIEHFDEGIAAVRNLPDDGWVVGFPTMPGLYVQTGEKMMQPLKVATVFGTKAECPSFTNGTGEWSRPVLLTHAKRDTIECFERGKAKWTEYLEKYRKEHEEVS